MKMISIILMSVLATSPIKAGKKFVPHKKSSVEFVTVTTYKVNEFKNDPNGDVTATGMRLTENNPKKHRIIAVSRDLNKKFKFGQKVRIVGAGKYSGIYVVKDLMNKRWRKRIDILINPEDKQFKLYRIKMYKA